MVQPRGCGCAGQFQFRYRIALLCTYIYQNSLSQLPYGDEEETSLMARTVTQYFVLWRLGMWSDVWACGKDHAENNITGRGQTSVDAGLGLGHSSGSLSLRLRSAYYSIDQSETRHAYWLAGHNLKLGYARLYLTYLRFSRN
jgi:hypothetical protein